MDSDPHRVTISVRAALIGPGFTGQVLGKDRNALQNLVEDGSLFPVWNIASPNKSKKRELRFLAASIAHFQKHGMPYPCDEAAILLELFPDSRTITTVTLSLDLGCERELTVRLIRKRHISLVPSQRIRVGHPTAAGAARIQPWSIRSFLKSRLVT